jgi:bifunctional DNA-binding transcriptional regulator/antitoxin component of YhaV-PrlF toxin-antitoxin module
MGEQAKLIRLRSVQTGKRAKSQRAVGDRPRTVTQVGQVSIPAAVLSRVGVEVLSRVYFVGLRSRSDTVWLLPESGLALADQRTLLDELLHESEEKRV